MNEKKRARYLFRFFSQRFFFIRILSLLTRNGSIVGEEKKEVRNQQKEEEQNYVGFWFNRVLTLNKKAFSYEKYENLRVLITNIKKNECAFALTNT